MLNLRITLRLFLLLIFTLTITSLTQAQSQSRLVPNDNPIASMVVEPTGVTWSPHVEYSSLVLTVSTPGGDVFRQEFARGVNPSFNLLTPNGLKLPDGHYVYELRLIPTGAPQNRAVLEETRENEKSSAVAQELQQQGESSIQGIVQSGSFLVAQGSVVSNTGTESANPKGISSQNKLQQTNVTAGPPPVNDTVTPNNEIIQGSLCVGLDCVNNESFGFDTIRLKENNTRITFQDTSTAAGFANNVWTLTANDSTSGGANKFSIDDVTGSKTPFTVIAGAPTNSFFLDSVGRLGLHTATPVLDVHLVTGNTPAFRMEQNASSGFTAQTWDIAGNEANFFVRDVTGGSRLPFRIRPGAPTSSIDIAANGNVGIGTSSPGYKLDVAGSINATAFYLNGMAVITSTFATGTGTQNQLAKWTTNGSTLGNSAITELNGNVGIGLTNPVAPLHIQGSTETVRQSLSDPSSFIQFAFFEGGVKKGAFGYQGSTSSGLVGGQSAMVFGTLTNSPVAFFTNGAEKVRLDVNGNVGIGTTTPQSLLQVNGYIQLALTTGAPPSTDCNNTTQYGRMMVDATNNKLYVCTSTGWKATSLN